VQGQINQIDPDFAVLLGDNIYDKGDHIEADGRFHSEANPEAAEWIAGHIDYFGIGNHDGPILGTEKPYDEPSGLYFQQMLPRLLETGVGLLLVGDSHTYSWPFPLTGIEDRNQNGVISADEVCERIRIPIPTWPRPTAWTTAPVRSNTVSRNWT
jgi:hypothetical protein